MSQTQHLIFIVKHAVGVMLMFFFTFHLVAFPLNEPSSHSLLKKRWKHIFYINKWVWNILYSYVTSLSLHNWRENTKVQYNYNIKLIILYSAETFRGLWLCILYFLVKSERIHLLPSNRTFSHRISWYIPCSTFVCLVVSGIRFGLWAKVENKRMNESLTRVCRFENTCTCQLYCVSTYNHSPAWHVSASTITS